MPHISIKCYPGRSEEQKQLLAEKITKDVVEVFQCGEGSVSVSVRDIPKENWDTEVWDKEIEPHKEFMYKKPDYSRG